MIKLDFRRPIISKKPSRKKYRKRRRRFYPISNKRFFLVVLTFFLVMQGVGTAQTPPKELPVFVTIKELLTEPNPYDGHPVVVAGRVRSMELQTGRRGSEFIMLVLEENSSDAVDPNLSIAVISLTLPKVRQGHHALIQGIYHREGRQAGRPFERFIDADTIVREKP
jgi:hypothetical protein